MTITKNTAEPLDADVPCIKCRYNLRTQLPTAACPECNTPVAESVAKWKLQDSQTSALRFRWLFAGAACLALYAVLVIAYHLIIETHALDVVAVWTAYSIGQPVLIILGAIFIIRSVPLRKGSLICLIVVITLTATNLADFMIRYLSLSNLSFWLIVILTTLELLRNLLTTFLLLAATIFMVDLWRRIGAHKMARATYPFLLLCAAIQLCLGVTDTLAIAYIDASWISLRPSIPPAVYPITDALASFFYSPYHRILTFSLYGIFFLYWLTSALLAKRLIKPKPLT